MSKEIYRIGKTQFNISEIKKWKVEQFVKVFIGKLKDPKAAYYKITGKKEPKS